MLQKFQKALAPVAAAFGAAAIALTPANDVNAQTARLVPVSGHAANTPTATAFALGASISISQYAVVAEQHNQVSLAKFNFMSIAANGSGQLNAGYITVNPTTGRGWLMKGDAELGKATSVTPIMELTNIVMFNPLTPGGGFGNLSRASPTIQYQNAEADCARWSRQLNMNFEEPSLHSCMNKNLFYNGMSQQQATVAVVGQVINGTPSDANVFVFTLGNNANAAERTGSIGRIGNNAFMTQDFIANYEIYPSVTNAIIANGGDLAGYIGTPAQPQQHASLNR